MDKQQYQKDRDAKTARSSKSRESNSRLTMKSNRSLDRSSLVSRESMKQENDNIKERIRAMYLEEMNKSMAKVKTSQ